MPKESTSTGAHDEEAAGGGGGGMNPSFIMLPTIVSVHLRKFQASIFSAARKV